MKGRIAFKRNRDSTLLKSVTSDSLFLLIRLNRKYIKSVNAPVSSPSLNFGPKSVEINGDKATCMMGSYEYYFLNLRKEEDRWIIYGENDEFPSDARVKSIRDKMVKQKEYLKRKPRVDSILRAANAFYTGVDAYFKTQEDEKLLLACDKATANFVKTFYVFAKKRTGLKLLLAEMKKFRSGVGDAYFDEGKDIVSFKFYKEEENILLRKNADGYTVVGVYNILSSDIKKSDLKYLYRNLLRSLKLTPSLRYMSKEIE